MQYHQFCVQEGTECHVFHDNWMMPNCHPITEAWAYYLFVYLFNYYVHVIALQLHKDRLGQAIY